ncbi:Sec-independent protein translocase protein TatA [Commensalibacter sp. Nvir]|uniref:twin-arginine translocase TatA/TatE family subunit n=1 Tax=Commensalibacter sp. Nvir TaxID=3069817 RepID=UPI002D6667B3|nr:Sec-independent protein translocase protein TatA [Commensalibacter sp. Nvir]
MGTMSIWHWLIVLIVILLLFGTSKVSSLMGDVAKGIKAFKKNMAEDESDTTTVRPSQPKPLPPSETSVPFNEEPQPFHEAKEKTPVSNDPQ